MRSEVGASGANLQHPDHTLARLPTGGFEIRAAGRSTIQVVPDGKGWRIEGLERRPMWILARALEQGSGFVLREADGDEVGRTMPLVGAGGDSGLRFMLLDDGRLFRIVLRGPRDVGFALSGWETPGDYVTARPDGPYWSLSTTAAGEGLEDMSAISILMGAEILDAEQPLCPETT